MNQGPEVNIGELGEGAGVGGGRKGKEGRRNGEREGRRRRRIGRGRKGSSSSSEGRVKLQERARCSALRWDLGPTEQAGRDQGRMCCMHTH